MWEWGLVKGLEGESPGGRLYPPLQIPANSVLMKEGREQMDGTGVLVEGRGVSTEGLGHRDFFLRYRGGLLHPGKAG